jgi:predicted nucleotidyltransferase
VNNFDERSLLEILRAQVVDPVAAYLFGSVARGDTSATSDLDIAVLAARPLAEAHRLAVEEQLAVAAGRDVDLVDLRRASTVLRAQVVGHGRLLFETDATARELFEDLVYSAYADLNEARRAIIEDARSEGRIFAR